MKIAYVLLGDIHFPFANWACLQAAADRVQQLKKLGYTVRVVQVGDILDQKAWSRFPKDPEDDSPALEWEKCETDMARLAKMFPELTILIGNHDTRIMKKAMEGSVPSKLIRGLGEIFDYPGWKWHFSNIPLVLEGSIAVMHGDESAGNAVAKAKNMGMSVIQGHDHQMYLDHINVMGKRTFGMGVGCMIDLKSKAFAYAAKNPMNVDIGFGEVVDGVPHLIPFTSK